MIRILNYNILYLDKRRFLDCLKKFAQLNKLKMKKNKKFVLMQLPIMQRWVYIQSTLYFNLNFYIYLSLEKILLLDTSLDCIVKVIKLLYNMLKVNTNRFATYHLYYKEKLERILTKFVYNLFFFRLLLKPLSLTSILSNFIIKFTIYYLHYKKIPRMTKCIYNFFFFWQPLQLLFPLSNLPNYICKFAIYYLYYKKKWGITEFAYNPFLFQLFCKQIFLFSASSDCIIKFIANYLYYKKIYKMTESVYKSFFYRPLSKLTESIYNLFLFWSLQKLLSLPDLLFDYIINFVSHHLYYKEKSGIVKTIYNSFLRSLFKLILLLSILSHYIIKIMNLLYNILDAGKYWFAIYHLHYKDKFVDNLTWAFICATNCLYFLRNQSNFSATFFFAYDSSTYTAKLSLVTRKRELQKISLHFFSCLPLLLSLFFSLTLFKICLAIFKCLAISKCIIIFEQQFSFLALANCLLLVDSLLVKLTSEKAIKKIKIMTKDCKNFKTIQHLPKTAFNSSLAAQITAQKVKFLQNNIVLLDK